MNNSKSHILIGIFSWHTATMNLASDNYRHQPLLRRPVRQVEQWLWCASYASPFDAPHLLQLWSSEGKGASIEQYGPSSLVHLPQAAPIRAFLSPFQQVTVLVHTAKAQHPILIYDKLLIHSFHFFVIIPSTLNPKSSSLTRKALDGLHHFVHLVRDREQQVAILSTSR